MRRNIFNNQTLVISVSFITIVVNLLASVHFVAVTLMGVMFYLSQLCFKDKMYYSLILVICTFLVIEATQGLYPFSLFIISFILYNAVLPLLKRIFAIEQIKQIVDIIVFYAFVIGLHYLANGSFILSGSDILLNIIIDLVFIGLFL